MEWSHSLLGQYDVGADNLAIDLARNFLDPIQAELVHVHEVTHATLGRTTDMGLASKPVYAHIQRFSHLGDAGKKRMIKAFYDAQVLPQEGFASLMECLHLAHKVGPTKAKEYARNKFPSEYYNRFDQLSYCMDMSHRYREYFTQKVPALAMETGFREVASSQDLLRSPEKLEQFFRQIDRNPTLRLQKMNEALRLKPWLITKTIDEIAAVSGLTLYEPADKEAIAGYMNYIGGLAHLGGTYTAEMVNDAPGPQALIDAAQDAVLTNINHNFSKDAEFLMDETAVDWEAEKADCAMFDMWPYYGEREQLIEKASNLKPEVAFAFFRRTGEKYIGFIPREKATALIEGPLISKTLITKHGLVDIVSGAFDLSKVKVPDIVYYDHPKLLHEKVKEAKDKISSVQYLNLGTTHDHPYRILALRVNEERPLHVANAFGGAKIADILSGLDQKTKLPDGLVRNDYRDAINDYFGFMGLPWQNDWIAMMLDKSGIQLR